MYIWRVYRFVFEIIVGYCARIPFGNEFPSKTYIHVEVDGKLQIVLFYTTISLVTVMRKTCENLIAYRFTLTQTHIYAFESLRIKIELTTWKLKGKKDAMHRNESNVFVTRVICICYDCQMSMSHLMMTRKHVHLKLTFLIENLSGCAVSMQNTAYFWLYQTFKLDFLHSKSAKWLTFVKKLLLFALCSFRQNPFIESIFSFFFS